MKKNKLAIWCIFFVLFLSAVSAQSNMVKSATELDYPPFSTPTTREDTAGGFSVELLKVVLESQDYNVSFYVAPWSEIKQDLIDGKIDVLPLVGRTPEREEYYDFTVPYITLRGAIFSRKGDTRINSIEDLHDKELIVMKGDNAEEYARRNNISDKLITTDTFEEAFLLLGQGKHDAIIAQELVGQQLINKFNIVSVEKKFSLFNFKQDFTFAVKKGNKDLLLILNEGLSKIISDGTFDNLYDRWLSELLEEKETEIRSSFSLDEKNIQRISDNIASQINQYIKNHPEKTIEDLQNDPYFQQLAVQQVSDSGYTSVIDANTGYIYFHPQKQLVNTDYHEFKEELPLLWQILNKSIGAQCEESSGYYDWIESDGKITQKYMYISCIEEKTKDSKELFVTTTTYLEESVGESYLKKYDLEHFDIAKKAITQKAIDVAKQVEIYLRLNPEMTIEDLQHDPYFQEIAVQKVGTTGYTSITDQETSEQYFHPDSEMIGKRLEDFKDIIPELWNFFEKELLGRCNNAGVFYKWPDETGKIRDKYAYSVCVPIRTADNKMIGVDASTYLDEYNLYQDEEAVQPAYFDIFEILSRNYNYSILFALSIITTIFFLLQTLKENYKGLSSHFKAINLLTLFFLTSVYVQTVSYDPLIKLYATRLVDVFALFLVLSFALLSLIVSFEKPVSKKVYVVVYLFFALFSLSIIFTGLFEKQIIFETSQPTIFFSEYGSLYPIVPSFLLILVIVPIFYLVKSYLRKKTKLLKNFLILYLVLVGLIIFDTITISILDINLSSLLMLTPLIVTISLYIAFLRNKLFQRQKTNTLLLIILIAFILMTSLFLLNTYETTKDIRENQIRFTEQSLEAIAVSRAKHVQTYLDQNIERFKLVTSRNKLRAELKQYNQDSSNEHLVAIEEIIKDAAESVSEFERICVISLQGEIISSTNPDFIGKNIADKEFFKTGLRSEKIYLLNEEGIPKLFVSGPFILDGEIIGVGITVVKTDYLDSIMTERTGFAETEEIYLINREGYMVTPSRFALDAVFNQQVDTLNAKSCWIDEIDPEKNIIHNHKIVLSEKDYRNVTVVGTHIYMQEMDWCLLAEQDFNESIASAEESIKNIWLFTLGVIITLILIAVIFSSILTETLRREVKNKTQEIEDINKTLENTVRQRTKELEDLTNDLEIKVKQRTADLKKKVQELEQFQKVTVGRELKMIELKKRINELEKKSKPKKGGKR